MDLIELNAGVIPFTADELAKNKYLPFALYDEKGFYYAMCSGKIYKTSEAIFIESVRVIFDAQPKAKFPKAIKSMEKVRSEKLLQMLKEIPCFRANRYLQEVTTLQKSFIFKQYNDINYLLKKEIASLTKSHFEYVAAPAIARQTAYGSANTSDALFEEFGIKIKKQDGKDFSTDEIKTALAIVKPVFEFLKIPKSMCERNQLVISFTHNKSMHSEGKAAGVFVSNYKSIGISFADSGVVLAHETGHWLDFVTGQTIANCFDFASCVSGTVQNLLAASMRSLMNGSETKSNYWKASTECLARSIEEYVCVELFKDESIYARKYYCNKQKYEESIKPLVQLILSTLK